MGALLTLHEPTPEMVKEAASAGFYHSPWGTKHPKIQLLTAEQLLAGTRLAYPAPTYSNVSLRKASRPAPKVDQGILPGLAKGPARYKQKRRARSK